MHAMEDRGRILTYLNVEKFLKNKQNIKIIKFLSFFWLTPCV